MLPRLPSFVLILALALGAARGQASEASCLTSADCDDGNRCTGDVCVAGTCTHRAVSDCTLEICGNCLDDDGNGLVDLADPACCAPERTAEMELAEGLIDPAFATSRLRLAGTLAGGSHLSPEGQQVLLQLGSAPNGSFCASLPPSAFRGTAERLRLGGPAVAGARGVRRMVLAQAADGSIRWRARGRRVAFSTDDRAGSLDIVLLLADAKDPDTAPRCFRARPFFRPGRRGTLVAD